jgi:uncharacterized protein (TIGR03435 family)
VLLVACAAGASAPSLHAQAALEPRFAVASIRAVDDPSGRLNRVDVYGDRFHATTISLTEFVLRAYGLPTFRIVGLPSWAPSVTFDVEAVAGMEVRHDEMMRMLRTLLQDRFDLEARIETREMPVYNLALTRQDRALGPGLRPSALDCGAFRTVLADWDRSHTGERPRLPPCEPSTRPTADAVHMRFPATTMSGFSALVASWVERVVVDRTGLSGEFDVEIEVSRGELPIYRALRMPGATAFAGPSLSTALGEQLGLTLEPGHAPVDVLIIDSVQREPRPN